MLITVFQAAPCTTLTEIVQKEAVYCAVGRCAGQLQNHVDFNQWLQSKLIPEARETNSM